jgi:ATP-binding cassette subfamily C protein
MKFKTEDEICQVIASLRGKLTVVAISHQDALQNAADIVYRLEGGKVALVRGAIAEEGRMKIQHHSPLD